MAHKTPLPMASATAHEKANELHPWLEALTTYARPILATLAGVGLLLLITLHFASGHQSQTEKDYHRAAILAEQIAAGTGSVDELSKLISHHPELAKIYAGLVAQHQLASDTPQQGIIAAEQLLSTADPSPFRAFSVNSLVITQGQTGQAIEQAEALDRQLETDDKTLFTLQVLNIIRLAALHDSVGNHDKARLLWRLADEKVAAQPHSALAAHLQAGFVSIDSYINR